MGRDWFAAEGSPFPLGASWVAQQSAFNFALYSRHARAVTLQLYGEDDFTQPLRSIRLDPFVNRSGRVWHARVPAQDAPGARYYAYSIDGPSDPSRGLYFDRDKVLLDPYASQLRFPPAFSRAAA